MTNLFLLIKLIQQVRFRKKYIMNNTLYIIHRSKNPSIIHFGHRAATPKLCYKAGAKSVCNLLNDICNLLNDNRNRVFTLANSSTYENDWWKTEAAKEIKLGDWVISEAFITVGKLLEK